MHNRRKLIVALGAGALTGPLGSFAQGQGKTWRIGFLSGRSRPDRIFEVFLQGLRDVGYVEGKNIVVEYRTSAGIPERVAGLAAELVQLKVDVIVSQGLPLILSAKRETKTIPIVFVINEDPVEARIVDSLARPGGIITGVTTIAPESSGKRLELVKETMPGIARVGLLWDATDPSAAKGRKEYEAVARAQKIPLQALEVRGPKPDLEGAFQAAATGRVGALIIMRSPGLSIHLKRIGDLAIKHQLPSICEGSEFVAYGCLMSYQTNEVESIKRAAYFVDKILKGAKPADLPVEQPTRFDLIINLKTAKAIGVKIPQSLVGRADKLIE